MALRNAILATLAYYDSFDHPLTAFEVHRYLVNPTRLSHATAALGQISLEDVLTTLSDLEQKGQVCSQWGFCALSKRDQLFKLRIRREKLAAQKWKKFRQYSFWLQAAPFVQGLFASGSMALGTTEPKSDFDLLVIAQSGRLYTARIFLSFIASILGVRRTRYERIAPDKLCFNHYITDHSLYINHESIYNAQSYAHLVPLFMSEPLFYKFYAENIWIYKYVYNFKPNYERALCHIKSNRALLFVSRTFEWLLGGVVGNYIERRARQYQHKRIQLNPATQALGGRIVFTDDELEFHPYSFEKSVLTHYNRQIKTLGVSLLEELDSGLQ